MMTRAKLTLHYTPEEAHQMLRLLDELRDAIWNHYHEEIITYCSQEDLACETESSFDFEDDTIAF